MVTIHATLNRHLLIVVNWGGRKLAAAGKLEIETLSVSEDRFKDISMSSRISKTIN